MNVVLLAESESCVTLMQSERLLYVIVAESEPFDLDDDKLHDLA
jgi:hypothetical protein